jgi:predicted nuclease with RNAse H fold
MTRLQPQQFLRRLSNNTRPHVGLDIAVNQEKGLRFVSRVEEAICEITLRLRPVARIARVWPYLDLPLPVGDSIDLNFVTEIFNLNDVEANIVLQSLTRAQLIAIDAPRGLATRKRRDSELFWHRLEIRSTDLVKPIKRRNGGVLWTPSAETMEAALQSYFHTDCARRATVQQITMLGQSLWMFVGFWMYELLRRIGSSTIEIYPHASRIISQEINQSPQRDTLIEKFNEWSSAYTFQDFIYRKTETNDAAIGSFTAFLMQHDLTEELAPDEIVIPRRPRVVGQDPILEGAREAEIAQVEISSTG